MIKTKMIKIEKEEEEIDKAFCSFCGNEFDETTTFSNGFGQIHFSFGYGSGFDDDSFSLEICDDCFLKRYFKLLKKQFEEKGYSLKRLNEKHSQLILGEKQDVI